MEQLFGKPTLVLQGAKDPLSNAVQRAREIEANCQNVSVTLLEAGHCPHDEVPELVNAELLRFMEDTVLDSNVEDQNDATSVTAAKEVVRVA